MIAAVLLVGAVVGVVLVFRRRGSGDVQRVQVDGPRPWAGPARLNGSASVRLPRSIPRPVEQLRRERRRRVAWSVGRFLPAAAVRLLVVLVLVVLVVVHELRGLW